MKKVRAWFLTTRPKTLLAAVGPVVLGQALAEQAAPETHSWLIAGLCLLSALALQVGVNLANDLFDGLSGVDQPDRLGPVRALRSGLLSAHELRIGTWLVLGVAIASGLYLIVFGHWLLWLLGAAALLAVYGYSGGRRPYANSGLGELVVWLFFGPVAVLGSMLAQQAPISWPAVQAAVLAGLPVAAILVVNNLRDRYTDARAGKYTLAVKLGHKNALLLYAGLTMLPLLPLLASNDDWKDWFMWGLLLFVAGLLNLMMRQRDGAALNELLGITTLYAYLFAMALLRLYA